MSIHSPPSDTYTDLTINHNYYETDCKSLFYTINKPIICKGIIDVTECCKKAIVRIYVVVMIYVIIKIKLKNNIYLSIIIHRMVFKS